MSAMVLHLFHQMNDTQRGQCLGIQRNIVWNFWKRASLACHRFPNTQ